MDRTRAIFVAIIVVTIGVVVAALLLRPGPQTVTGLSGSEKEPFFVDQRVQDRLRELGLVVNITKAGSREIATSFNLNDYDFAFPAGTPATRKIRDVRSGTLYEPFFTPMVIASFQPIADLLVAQGIASDMGGYYTVDLEQLMALIEAETRWEQLPTSGVSATNPYAVRRRILVTTTDVRSSNSAAMFLALASYIANANNIVPTLSAAQPNMPLLTDLFLAQGLPESSSLGPFENYVARGLSYAPLVWIYEAQFIADAARADSPITDEMVLLYPTPTVFSQHTLVGFTEAGQRLGEVLTTDPELQQLAIEYGFRTRDSAAFRAFTAQHGIRLPEQIIEVVEPPSYEVLEGMIIEIEQAYGQ